MNRAKCAPSRARRVSRSRCDRQSRENGVHLRLVTDAVEVLVGARPFLQVRMELEAAPDVRDRVRGAPRPRVVAAEAVGAKRKAFWIGERGLVDGGGLPF